MSKPKVAHGIEIRHCTTLAEYDECVRLEHLIWGESIAVPSPIFVVAHHTGGQVLGAFSKGRMAGFTLGLAATRAGTAFLHSHITAVLPEFRDRRVGRSLKVFQRKEALKRGIELIEWTFDPLELKNAHFNFVRLGAVARRYIPNCYGVTTSPLHAGLPTDRLVAEWRLNSERVKSILAADPLPLRTPNSVRVSLPANLEEIRASDRVAAARIQADAGEEFKNFFAHGYVVTGIERHDSATDYILEPSGAIAGLHLPQLMEE
jgi:predicted GNAT superfamily acetyltransferase